MSVSGLRAVGAIALASLVLTACAGVEVADTSSTSTTDVPTTTTTATAGTSTTEADVGLDLAEWMLVTNGPEGVRLDGHEPLWPTQPFPAAIARDRQGGFVFTDSTGFWWFRPNHVEPTKVSDVTGDFVSVLIIDEDPVAMVWDGSSHYIRLSDGEPVDVPAGSGIDIDSFGPWMSTRTADNGLSAWVTQPDVVLDAEGQPEEVVEPSHLVVARGEEVLLDIPIGRAHEEWATLHDFDGRHVIVSIGPYEPAMPEETFRLIDLSTGEVLSPFVSGGTNATLTQPDTEWDGPVVTPDLGL